MLRQTSMKSFTTDDQDIFPSSFRISCDWRDAEVLRSRSDKSDKSTFQANRKSKSVENLISQWETLDSLHNANVQKIRPLGKKGSLRDQFCKGFSTIEETQENDQKVDNQSEFKKYHLKYNPPNVSYSERQKDINNNVVVKNIENEIKSYHHETPSVASSILRFQNLPPKNPRTEKLKVGGLSRKESYKMSKKLSRKMTLRQKQKLIMESEFDEFEDFNEDDKNLKNKVNVSNKTVKDVDVVTASKKNSIYPPIPDKNNVHDAKESQVPKITLQSSSIEEDDLITKLNMRNMQDTIQYDTSDQQEEDEDYEDDDEDDVEGRVVLTKVQKIAEELLLTEKNYIDRLHLLDQVFQMNVTLSNREYKYFPDQTIPAIFSNIKSIYQFHTFLYPQLEKAVVAQQHPKIGDVLSKFGPFLKLYIEYVNNFNQGINLLNYWLEKSAPFNHLISELQKRPECGHLTLQHHMLEPVQRVPRYELLLKDYLKNLPENSLDRLSAEKSLKIVKDAAQHSNDAMRKIEKFKKLLDVNEKLGDSIDLVSPTRELVKEGRIMRVARDGSLIERYIFLFNDILLVCQAGALTQQYRIKSKMNIDDMEVTESHNLEIPNTFHARCQEKSVELHCSSHEEKVEWQMAFVSVIQDFQEKLKTRKRRLTVIYPVKSDLLGKRAPMWIKDNETSMCMRCSVTFTAFRRRHHCRACGLVVCRLCSAYKAHLDFTGNSEDKVCSFCYQVLAGNQAGYLAELGEVSVSDACASVMEGIKADKKRLQVKASAASVMSGYMSLSRDRHNWIRRYFAARENFVLYSYKAHQDLIAMASLPLPGYHVEQADPSEIINKEHMFKIYHSGEKKVYFFQVESIETYFKWLKNLQMLSKLEVPKDEDH